MPSTSIEDAQAHLAAWIAQLMPGEELVIIERDHPVARLMTVPAPTTNEDDLGDTITAQMESAMQSGWSDPLMDEYNDYDSHRGQS